MRIFRKDYMQLAIMIIIHVCANFAGPIGINRLLRYAWGALYLRALALIIPTKPSYLEPGGETAVVRPWFWILWLFIGPVGGTISIQWYIFIAVSLYAFVLNQN